MSVLAFSSALMRMTSSGDAFSASGLLTLRRSGASLCHMRECSPFCHAAPLEVAAKQVDAQACALDTHAGSLSCGHALLGSVHWVACLRKRILSSASEALLTSSRKKTWRNWRRN